ncbi:hypothetical protein KDK_00300 [Dictyobacter kobayashii]|uniref:Uncharacterized protein n=1 Tax=Dictyobacter kobayashii TaxID=2014872 RepID=A0A402AAT1_9CHLR|nr:hypothetical protein [Dictyobacter kobayashii]GCE16230.1 hypothetical protein KDK_00300 [Dictyobacter kobayashii]
MRSEIEAKIKAVRDALSSNDITRVRTASNELETTTQRINPDVYSQAGTSAGTETSAGASTSDSDTGTVEGEYREV